MLDISSNSHHSDLHKQINGTLECNKETHLGINLQVAFDKCKNGSDFSKLHAWNSKLKGSNFFTFLNSKSTCHTFLETKEWILNEYQADICILKSISWLDQNLDIIDENINSDMRSALNGNEVVCNLDFQEDIYFRIAKNSYNTYYLY